MDDLSPFERGVRLAEEAVRRRAAERPPEKRRGGPYRGLLIAEGDSWFDYPFSDVLDRLGDAGYAVESVAHRGDNIEDMAHDPKQVAGLTRAFEKLGRERKDPKAILLSGGGNDIAGEEFRVLLNHRGSGLPAVNPQIVDGIVNVRLRAAVACLMGVLSELCRHHFGASRPILIHGYDYPVPDGRGFWGGGSVLPGPWLEPGFRRKGHHPEHEEEARAVLEANTTVMRELIDAYNAMLAALVPTLPNARYVDLRGTLASELEQNAYRRSWADELHPTRHGFERVAGKLIVALEGL
jgi:hypothetical protein